MYASGGDSKSGTRLLKINRAISILVKSLPNHGHDAIPTPLKESRYHITTHPDHHEIVNQTGCLVDFRISHWTDAQTVNDWTSRIGSDWA